MKIRDLYKDVSLVCMNLGILFIVINLLSLAGLKALDYYNRNANAAIRDDLWAKRAKVYPGLNDEQISRLYKETWELRQYVYSPFSQFAEKPFSGEYVNVTEAKIRKSKIEAPWPPPKEATTIFVFGGSTTFGYGLPDWETVPSFLGDALAHKHGDKIFVYNFGKAYFYSTHEMLEFQRLLWEGHRPDIAIFIDGLNEFYFHEDKLAWTERLTALTEHSTPSTWDSIQALARRLPIFRMIDFLIHPLNMKEKSRTKQAEDNYSRIATGGGLETSNRIIDRYLRNKSLIETLGRHFGTVTLFVWQPVPTYKYDTKYHLFVHSLPEGHIRSGLSYDVAQTRYGKGDFGESFAWCADIQDGLKKPLYVDAVHYNAELSQLLANCIFKKTNLEDTMRANKF